MMGAIAQRIAQMKGHSLAAIVAEVERMEAESASQSVADTRYAVEFEAFWKDWPNRVGKPAARRAYNAARKRGAKPSAIMDGLTRYIFTKPADRPWLNPATFLNQERFNDQPALVIEKGLAGERTRLLQELVNDPRSAGETHSDRPDARRLAHGGSFDQQGNSGRLL